MEFGIKQCHMLVRKRGKRHIREGVELSNKVIIRTLGEKESYKYLAIFEADNTKEVEMKEKKCVSQKSQRLFETKLYSWNLVKDINTWALPLVRNSGAFLKRTIEELKQMDQRTRKLMTKCKALHPRDDV